MIHAHDESSGVASKIIFVIPAHIATIVAVRLPSKTGAPGKSKRSIFTLSVHL